MKSKYSDKAYCQYLIIMLFLISCKNEREQTIRQVVAEWKRIMAEADTLLSGEVDFLFFFQPKRQDERELQFMFRNNGFRHPVFIDTGNEIDKLNKQNEN